MSYFTSLPNEIIDTMHEASGSAVKVVCAIARLTVGYSDGNGGRKETDTISVSQLCEITGLSNRVVIRAVNECVDLEWVSKRKISGNSVEYGLACRVTKGHSDIEQSDDSSQWQSDERSQQNDEKSQQNDEKSQQNDEKSPGQSDDSSHTNINNTSSNEDVAGATANLPIAEQFRAYVDELKTTKNRQAVLRNIYVLCFGEDNSTPSYAYLGKVANQVGGAGYLAGRLWELTARPPNGDVLAYIVAQHKSNKARREAIGADNRAIQNPTFT